MKLRALFIFLAAAIAFCASAADIQQTLDGHWRAIWMSSRGEIPVDLFIKTLKPGQLEAEVHNAAEVIKFDRVIKAGGHIDFYIDHFESQISADISPDGKSLSGTWSKQTGTPNRTPFAAHRGDTERFPKAAYPGLGVKVPIADVTGEWKLRFEGDDYDSTGLFKQEGEKVTGTIRAIDGDFRWLEGVYRNGQLILSSFNGSWIFIFKAEMDSKGILNGFWARGPREPIRWTAEKGPASYPDTFRLTKLKNTQRTLRFKYPLAENHQRLVTNADPEFKDKPLLVAMTTTGCPNSHQSAEFLSRLYKEYHGLGLNMVFINFELTKDVPKIVARIKRFKQEYDLPVPILFSQAMSKEEIGKEMPDFVKFLAWPTVIFYDKTGKVDTIHTGIDGPATGVYYTKMVDRYREIIERLLPAARNAQTKGFPR